ncbi:hypothetical protein [Streptomyces xanthophaeus]|uniref:hypothetical protein n=1 Tax=Streptomyces xanthophaeus TaxID=67385 RepID=UPI00366564CE
MITCHACTAEAVVQWQRLLPGKDVTDTEPVYACADHSLTPEAAAYAHRAECTGPGKGGACSCPAPSIKHPFPGPGNGKRLPPRW